MRAYKVLVLAASMAAILVVAGSNTAVAQGSQTIPTGGGRARLLRSPSEPLAVREPITFRFKTGSAIDQRTAPAWKAIGWRHLTLTAAYLRSRWQ